MEYSLVKKIPLKKDYMENFEPVNPFCRGWTPDVEFDDPCGEEFYEDEEE